uniref:J domain-containing protein n=1 Tax=Amphimedon queenslandica TaxID=400682 RepID=A0A1X7UF52_AMPQE
MATVDSNEEDGEMQSSTDYYDLLQVDKDASRADIKAAYHKMSRKYHPDKTLDSTTEEIMKKLNDAKTVLLDEVRRAEYDDRLEGDDTVTDPKGFYPVVCIAY